MQLSCESCLWWEPEPDAADLGRCHRFPPSATGFPAVPAATYCGEFTARSYAAAARRAVGASAPGVDSDVAATIAAAVAMTLPEAHRILAVQPVAGSSPPTWPFAAPLNTWALGGRVQLFSSHKVR
ncbi:MAG: hypothetical protein ABSC03_05555 [Verrucomicrobiota bacterium]|jgi:hypothetical protein